jgi:hypothetical protein
MSNPNPFDIASYLDGLSDQQRIMFFEQVAHCTRLWSWSQSYTVSVMFPPRNNHSHQESLDMCRNYVKEHGYLTRIEVLPDMPASTFRRSILGPLLTDGVIEDSGDTWKKDGQGQGHKVYRDKTRRYRKLTTPVEVVANNSLSIVNEPERTARQFVSQVLTISEVLKVGFPKLPGLVLSLSNAGFTDVSSTTVINWCKVVANEIRKQSETNPALKVYAVHNGKISVKTNSGVMRT